MEKLVLRLKLVDDSEFNAELRPEPAFSIGKGVNFVRTQIQGPLPERPAPSARAILDAVIDTALKKVQISNIRQSFVFRITVTTEERAKSALIANTLADLYILDQLEVKFEATQKATEWLSERVGELQIDLEKALAAVEGFSASSELVSPQALEAVNIQIKSLRERRTEAVANRAAALTRAQQLNAALQGGDLDAMTALADDRTLTRLNGIIADGTDGQEAFNARYQQILERAELDVERGTAQVTAFDNSIAELDAQVTRQSADLVTLQQLQREAAANQAIYESFLARLKETSVQQGIQQADSRMLSAAVVPRTPSAPRKSMIMALALMLGFMTGVGLVLARELAQNTIRTPEDLETLTGKVVLGQIPLIPARSRSNVLKYLTDKPTSAAAEAIRNLRTSTLLSNVDQPPQIIMSTSSLPGEGKTTQSLALTQNLSGLGKKVLLIEGDIRRRVFAQYFDIKNRKGILSVLSGNTTLKETAVYNDVLKADILIGEKGQVNAADVFSSESFEEFMEDARRVYDYIVIDTPPVLIVPDARIIGRHVDATLYTVKWDHTTKRQVVEGLKSFATVDVPVAGLVLGQINAKGMKRYGYGDGYGAYGKYGAGYYDS